MQTHLKIPRRSGSPRLSSPRLGGLLIAILAGGQFAASALAADCDVAAIKAPADITIVSAKVIAEPVNYCRVDGYVTTTNPGPNKVNFMVALPEKSNGRYVFTIQGGAAAFVP